jgi:DNA-binding NarL/FixJ family response regulator
LFARVSGASLAGMPSSGVRDPNCPAVVKVLVVDDHPALRAGLESLLGQENGFVSLGALADEREVTDAIDESRPDVVILDHALDGGDGLRACFRIKQLPAPPGVVLYSGYVDSVFAVPAALAQADAIVSKSAPVDELLSAIRAVAAGEHGMPPLDRDAMAAASSRLAVEDLPVVGMLFARISVDEIAETLDVSPDEVRLRALRIIGELQARDRFGTRARVREAELALG